MITLLSIFAIGFLLVTGQNVLAADSATPEIWMFAGPRVANVAPGWESLRTDSGDMWKPDAPWETVAHAVKVIQFAPTNVDRARDSDLQQAVANIKRRNIALAVGDG